MEYRSELSKFSVEEMLNELAIRCNGALEAAETSDLAYELSHRKNVDTTIVDSYDIVQLKVEGPAVIFTVFD